MKKTKIICTMGPASDDRETMRELVRRGMDIARFNFSHGTHEEQKARMEQLKMIREQEKKPIAILLDTKGPEIRTGTLKEGKKVTLAAGQAFILSAEEKEGDASGVSITYPGLVDEVHAGKKILIDDGLIELTVTDKTEKEIHCVVDNGGELGERKGVNVPGVPVRLPAITEKDKEDIRFGVEQQVDFIAASFVRNAECILEIKAWLKECGAPYIPIIAKIENREGIENIDEIVRCADGLMVARGDLGVEIPPEEVPYLQKVMIKKCNEYYKPVIIATQMLDSMIRNPRPTRAEVTDVANAVYDGTDAVMLSGETASGKYPVDALDMMVHIVESTEQHLDYEAILESRKSHQTKGISPAIGYASVAASVNLNARCIVTPTVSGATARITSKFKPKADIIGVTPDDACMRRMQIYWGVRSYKSMEFKSTEDILNGAIDLISAKHEAEPGEVIILTAGLPSPNIKKTKDGASNTIRIAVID